MSNTVCPLLITKPAFLKSFYRHAHFIAKVAIFFFYVNCLKHFNGRIGEKNQEEIKDYMNWQQHAHVINHTRMRCNAFLYSQ